MATEQDRQHDYTYSYQPTPADADDETRTTLTIINVARSFRMDRIRADLSNNRRSECLRKRGFPGRGPASPVTTEKGKEV